jgi:hypothetical protein
MAIPLTKPTKGANMNNDLEELRGFTTGANLAFLNLMRAVIHTHPNPQALAAALEGCRQDGLVVLTNSTHNVDKAIETFHGVWDAALLGQPGQATDS